MKYNEHTGKYFHKTFYFWSKFKTWSPKGKSSKIKDEIIEDMYTCMRVLRRRIEKMQYAIDMTKKGHKEAVSELKKEQTKARNKLKVKISTREARVERTEEKVAELEKALRESEKRERVLEGKIERMVSREADLKKRLKEKVKTKVVYRRKLEKEVEKLPVEAERYKRYTAKTLNERGINAQEVATKTLIYLSRTQEVSATQLSVLSEVNIFGTVDKNKLDTQVSKTTISTMTANGLIGSERVGNKSMLFLTPKGKEIVDGYLNYLSYGKLNTEEELI